MREHYEVREEDIAAFERDGAVVLRGVLDNEDIATLAGGITQVVQGLGDSVTGYDLSDLRHVVFEQDQNSADTGGAAQYDVSGLAQYLKAVGSKPLVDNFDGEEAKGHFRLDSTTWRRYRPIRKMALDSVLPEIAGQIMRSPKVNYCDDQIFVKDPMTKDRTAFHQDYTYFHLKGWQGCVMWVCVDPATPESGVPYYVRGSHKWGKEYKTNPFLVQTSFPDAVGEDLPEISGHEEDYDLVRFETKPGDVLIHHFRTIHGASGNHSNLPRRAASLRYIGQDMRYFNRPGAPAQPYHDHNLKDGDVLDSRSFPVVWPKPYPGFALTPLYDAPAEPAAQPKEKPAAAA
ncbi:MAG TPA: phytanoyl-CoA dioxygenase family protein [Rhizomicrobium sp.]|nr:phytanoyl-CoA dioxygenase family protein [Rhizomicrobium sp.]